MWMKSIVVAVALVAVASIADAVPITSGTVTLDGTESLISTDRVNRDGVASTWAGPKPYPGTLACLGGGNCFYETVTVSPSPFEFISVSYEWIAGSAANIFLVGYLNSFSTANLATNYLGDPGLSVSLGDPGPRSFQVVVPNGDNLELVFSTVRNNSFGTVSYIVEGFDSPAAVPEPVTGALVASGFALVALRRRRNKR